MAPTTTTTITAKQCTRCLDTKPLDQFDLHLLGRAVLLFGGGPVRTRTPRRKSFCIPCGKILASTWKAREARTATRRRRKK